MAAVEYEEVLSRLSSLISRRTRADASNKGDRFELIFDYLKMLELDDNAISKLNVVHVSGTKGKGSTCTFVESILRNCGFHTGLYTSPHLIDIRERFKMDGVALSEKKFVEYFWWCWNRLQERINGDDIPMPNYFRFLTLLAFKIFSAEQVDVAILEVGLGGKFDATNVVKTPVVCGVSSLGYDHMAILGNTLGEIAGEKAGIFKENVEALTVPQPEDAMQALEERASQLGIPLSVIPPLRVELLNGQKLGLSGEHQYINAGLAVSLCRHWLKNTGNAKEILFDDEDLLPNQFIRGLATADLPGRAQIVPDPFITQHSQENLKEGLIFYLDGAHSPESMEVCGRWFSNTIKKEELTSNSILILLFNCMTVRDPQLLLPPLVNTCAEHGIKFHKSIFVPNLSVFNQVTSQATHIPDSSEVDVLWQQKLQMVWQDLEKRIEDFGGNKTTSSIYKERRVPELNDAIFNGSSSVVPSLISAIKMLRDISVENPSFNFKVLVTGSLHLVGDVLKVIHG